MDNTQQATYYIKTKYLTKLLLEVWKMINVSSVSLIDLSNAELRLKDITALYKTCSGLYEGLTDVHEDAALEKDWSDIRNDYYKVAAKIKDLRDKVQLRRDSSMSASGPIGSSTFIEKQKLLKLPFVDLLKFSGDHEQWLSYKNAFLNMIDTRTNIDNVVKLTYLRDTLKGEALSKIALYDISAENYTRAWQTLIDSYERKHILISKHLDALFDINPVASTSSKDLSKLVDDAKQHLNTLKSLDVSVPDRVSVRLLERALPSSIRQKWEEKLTLDELPSIKEFYSFIHQTVARSFTMEIDSRQRPSKVSDTQTTTKERQAAKMRKANDGTRVMVTSVDSNCVICKQVHFLYKCPEFLKLAVQKRWDFIKANKLCYNCLRSHAGKCDLGPCKFCPKRHDSLLHSEPKQATGSARSGSAVDPKDQDNTGFTAA